LRNEITARNEPPTATASTDTPPVVTWDPFPDSPQSRAFTCLADELFYGGAAGAGKSELLLGLAFTAHRQSIIFRREYPQLKGMIQRSRRIVAGRGRYNGQHSIWSIADGRTLEFGAVQHEWDREKYQGRPHDLIGFDELTHFLQSQYRFLIGWNRPDNADQLRCRVVATGNPPTSPEGRWVIEEWAPWLDEHFPDPAEPGELRWYTVIDEKLQWFKTGEPITHNGEVITPRSRTFIPGRVDDNPVLLERGYKATLQALPEPLRSQMLYGDFSAGTEDDAYQVIPTAWVRAAQSRWTPAGHRNRPLSCLGVDVARSGTDKTTLSPRYGTWFGHVEKHAGRTTPDGQSAAALIKRHLLPHGTAVPVNIDVIGVGAAAYDLCREWRVSTRVHPVNVANAVDYLDRSGTLSFANLRAYAMWSLRESLDPANPPDQQIALPPDPELLADLCAPQWKLLAGGIRIESKDDIKKRIGRSPDAGDAVILAHLTIHLGFTLEGVPRAPAPAAHELIHRKPPPMSTVNPGTTSGGWQSGFGIR
jgi:hypothetical protein